LTLGKWPIKGRKINLPVLTSKRLKGDNGFWGDVFSQRGVFIIPQHWKTPERGGETIGRGGAKGFQGENTRWGGRKNLSEGVSTEKTVWGALY